MADRVASRVDYKSDVVIRIVNAIRESGNNDTACQAGGIAKTTFYKWLKKHPEFKSQVDEAHKDFIDSNPLQINRRLTQLLYDVVNRGYIEDVKIHKEKILNGKGEVTSQKISETTLRKPIPRWVFDAVRHGSTKPMALMEAMEFLLREGVATTEQASIVRTGVEAIEVNLKSLKSAAPGSNDA
jgi:hypothetical protein